jgi:hypothetical protein
VLQYITLFGTIALHFKIVLAVADFKNIKETPPLKAQKYEISELFIFLWSVENSVQGQLSLQKRAEIGSCAGLRAEC